MQNKKHKNKTAIAMEIQCLMLLTRIQLKNGNISQDFLLDKAFFTQFIH